MAKAFQVCISWASTGGRALEGTADRPWGGPHSCSPPGAHVLRVGRTCHRRLTNRIWQHWRHFKVVLKLLEGECIKSNQDGSAAKKPKASHSDSAVKIRGKLSIRGADWGADTGLAWRGRSAGRGSATKANALASITRAAVMTRMKLSQRKWHWEKNHTHVTGALGGISQHWKHRREDVRSWFRFGKRAAHLPEHRKRAPCASWAVCWVREVVQEKGLLSFPVGTVLNDRVLNK